MKRSWATRHAVYSFLGGIVLGGLIIWIVPQIRVVCTACHFSSIFVLPITGIIVSTFYLSAVKNSIIRKIGDLVAMEKADFSMVQGINVSKMEDLGARARAIGFEKVEDFIIRKSGIPGGAASLFVDKGRGIFLEIHQILPIQPMQSANSDQLKVGMNLMTMMSDGMKVSSTSHQPNAMTYMMRMPSIIYECHPDLGLESLTGSHVRFVGRVEAVAKTKPKMEFTFDAYRNIIITGQNEKKIYLDGRWIVMLLLDIDLFEGNPKSWWYGKLSKQLQE